MTRHTSHKTPPVLGRHQSLLLVADAEGHDRFAAGLSKILGLEVEYTSWEAIENHEVLDCEQAHLTMICFVASAQGHAAKEALDDIGPPLVIQPATGHHNPVQVIFRKSGIGRSPGYLIVTEIAEELAIITAIEVFQNNF